MPFDMIIPGLAEASIKYAFRNSDILGQSIVVGLFLFSIITWVIMIDKGISLKHALQDSAAFLAKFRSKRSPMTFSDRIEEELSPTARVCEAAYLRLHQLDVEQPDGTRRILTDNEIDIVRATLEQAVADQIIVLEGKMIFLATAVSISPFLGLFGTVWGIMLAFTELAIAGKADIQTLAPGVSGALLTTVLGLVVAIPSVVGYNIITSRIKSTIVHLDNFVEEFIVKLKIDNSARQEQERLRKLEEDRQEKARLEQIRQEEQEKARLENDRFARMESARKEELELIRQQARQAEIERARQEQAHQAEIERLKQEQARLEQEKLAEQERIRQEQARLAEQERIRQEQARLEQEKQAEIERAKQEQARQAEIERAKQEQARQAELERIKQEQARLEQEKQAEQERIRYEQSRQAELDRIKQEQTQLEQLQQQEQPDLLNQMQAEQPGLPGQDKQTPGGF